MSYRLEIILSTFVYPNTAVGNPTAVENKANASLEVGLSEERLGGHRSQLSLHSWVILYSVTKQT